MRALLVAHLLLACLVCCTHAATCANPISGVPITPDAHWGIVGINFAVSDSPFIAYVTKSDGFGTVACTDAYCVAPATFTYQNTSQAPIGIQPALLFRNFGNNNPLIAFHYPNIPTSALVWISCATTNCNSSTPVLVKFNSTSPTLTALPNQDPVVMYFDDVGTNVQFSAQCSTSACTALNARVQVDATGGHAIGPYPPHASMIGNDSNILSVWVEYATLQIFRCTDPSCINTGNNYSNTSIIVGDRCRIAVTQSSAGLPLIAFCDEANADLYVAYCADLTCSSPVVGEMLAAGVGVGALPGGVQLSIATRPCGGQFPIVAYAKQLTGELGVIDCNTTTCSQGIRRILYTSGAYYASMVIPPIGHPLEGMPFITFSKRNGATYTMHSLICTDGSCQSCESTAAQPTPPATTPCGSPYITPPPPPTTIGPLGPCFTTTNCGRVPVTTLQTSCCNGVWIIWPDEVLEVNAQIDVDKNVTCYWEGNWEHRPTNNLTVHLEGDYSLSVSAQPVVVDGNATIDGPLYLIIESPPSETISPELQIVATTSMSGGVVTGNFTEPIVVSLQYDGSECASGSAEQRPSTYGVSVLISVDKSRCKGKGLSKDTKIAIGVVVGVVGFLLLLLLVFFALRLFAPTWAQKKGLMRPSVIQVGQAYGGRREW